MQTPGDAASSDACAPVVSVVVPCWNAAATIEAALASVLTTTSVPLEVVVVDDASTDDTPSVLATVAARDPRVIVIRQAENAGVSEARNRALASVRGEWLAFLDADDRWLSGGLDRLVAHALAGDALAVLGQRVWTDGRATWRSNDAIPDVRIPGRKSLASHPGLVYYAAIHGKLLHRSTWAGSTFKGRVLGDQPWTIGAMLRAGDRIDVLPDVVYEWRRPRVDTAAGGITAKARSSAKQGAEAARVAVGAFAEVAADAELWIADEPARSRFMSVYLDRLLSTDLGGHVRRALDRRDPTMPDLFLAIAAFLDTVAADLLATSDALGDRLLVPPLHHWPWLAPDAKAAWAAMAAPAFRADPTLERRIAGERTGRWSVHVRTRIDRAAYLLGRGRLAVVQGVRRGRARSAGHGRGPSWPGSSG